MLITGQSEKEKQYHKKISEKNQKRERLPRGIYQEKRRWFFHFLFFFVILVSKNETFIYSIVQFIIKNN